MKINRMIIKDIILGHEKEYYFGDNTLVNSNKNSQGKTTLMRLLLYGLGYAIPSTKGIGDFYKLETVIYISGSKIERVHRRHDICKVYYTDKSEEEFVMPMGKNNMHAILFGISNMIVLENLLGCFYIDQEKGWTILNRGKVIGGNRFNIEDFVSGISGGGAEDVSLKINTLKRKIKREESLLSIASYQEQSRISVDKRIEDVDMAFLSKEHVKYMYLVEKDKEHIKEYKNIRKQSSNLLDIIEKSRLMVVLPNGSKVSLSKDNIDGFRANDEYISRLQLLSEQELNVHEGKLKQINDEIAKRSTVFKLEDSIVDSVERALNNIDINVDVIESDLRTLKKKCSALGKERRGILNTHECTKSLYNDITTYARSLDVYRYIKNYENDFIFTNNLKVYSGMILSQLSLVFKLAYINLIKTQYGLRLPIIIDSPRASEITAEGARKMMNVIKDNFPDHQLIVASVYDDFIDGIDNRITIQNGVLGTKSD